MSDKQLKIKVKSIQKKAKNAPVENDQTIGPFKVNSKNQNALKLLAPKSACDNGSIVSTVLGEDEFTENRAKSIDDMKAAPSNQSNA